MSSSRSVSLKSNQQVPQAKSHQFFWEYQNKGKPMVSTAKLIRTAAVPSRTNERHPLDLGAAAVLTGGAA
jgi:hypothetical protein